MSANPIAATLENVRGGPAVRRQAGARVGRVPEPLERAPLERVEKRVRSPRVGATPARRGAPGPSPVGAQPDDDRRRGDAPMTTAARGAPPPSPRCVPLRSRLAAIIALRSRLRDRLQPVAQPELQPASEPGAARRVVVRVRRTLG